MTDISPKVIVCIFAHPDDEAFGPGGTIAHFAGTIPVHVICVTDGDGGGDNKLGEVRKQEMTRSIKTLDAKSVQFLGFHDGSLNNNSYHEIAEKVKEQLDAIKPDTVITFDPNGISGHLDHIAVSMISSYLFERTDYLRTLMYYCEGPHLKQALGTDYFVYVPPGRTTEINFTLDVSAVYETKVKAMRQHVSQKEDCDWILEMQKDKLKQEQFIVWQK